MERMTRRRRSMIRDNKRNQSKRESVRKEHTEWMEEEENKKEGRRGAKE